MAALKPDQLIEIDIDKLVPGGEGFGRYEGLAVFVPEGLPGDRVSARVISLKPGYARALITDVLSPAPTREVPPCPYVASCGGCQWQHQHYTAQLAAKRDLLLETLSSFGGWDRDALEALCAPVAGMQEPWHYRNKGQFPFQQVQGQLEAGFYAPRSHHLVAIDQCLIHHQRINEILAWSVTAARQAGLQAYDEQSHSGDLRHLIIRHGFKTDQTLVGFVTRQPKLAGLHELAVKLREAFPSVVGVVQNINPKAGNRILGDETRVLAGSGSYLDAIENLRFEVSLPSFFQVNPVQTEVLYASAAHMAEVSADEIVVDAYSGAGTIALSLARHCQEVIGIEVVSAATADAGRNARLNGSDNVRFITGKVEDELPGLVKRLKQKPVVILDPPRKGCEPSVLATVAKAGIERVVYVSCNPATLARDSALLKNEGYTLDALQPVDMFPHTHHLETVARFRRQRT